MRLGWKILICVLVVEILGGFMALTMGTALKDWYPGLEKPPGTPPNWVFGPVWSTLYAMLGVALALVWHRADPGTAKRAAFIWFTIQLFLNLAWTPVFFGMRQMGFALVIIVILWIAIVMTIRAFRQLDRTAGWLLVPYLVWVSYATWLNAGNWWLNR